MSERATSGRRGLVLTARPAGEHRRVSANHPAGSARPRPQLVLIEGGRRRPAGSSRPALRERLRRALEFVAEGFATLPEQHLG